MYINTPITREFIVAVAVSKRHAADWATRFLILFFSLFFHFWAVLYIKLAILSAFERTLIYRIVSYRIRLC